jgi:hypothetical protein
VEGWKGGWLLYRCAVLLCVLERWGSLELDTIPTVKVKMKKRESEDSGDGMGKETEIGGGRYIYIYIYIPVIEQTRPDGQMEM